MEQFYAIGALNLIAVVACRLVMQCNPGAVGIGHNPAIKARHKGMHSTRLNSNMATRGLSDSAKYYRIPQHLQS